MSIVAERALFTPEDLLRLPGAKHAELINGNLVEQEMGLLSGIVAERVSRRVGEFVEQNNLGWTPSSECGYQCFPGGRVRKPDASFINAARLPSQDIAEGHVPFPPDLAIEVVSFNDTFSEVVSKAEEYLDAGVPLVWVVDPPTRSVYVYRRNGSVDRFREEQLLDGEEVLPGFSCFVSDLFPV